MSDGVKGTGRVLFLVSTDWYFLSHRARFARHLVENGWEVAVACRVSGKEDELRSFGVEVFDLRIDRSSLRFGSLLKEIVAIRRILRSWKPDIAHVVALRMIFLCGAAWRTIPSRSFVVLNAVAGMGSLFSLGRLQPKYRVARKVMGMLFPLVLRGKAVRTVFQNEEDLEMAREKGWLGEGEGILIRGVGVPVASEIEAPVARSEGEGPTFLFVGRLLRDKGIRELIEASRSLSRNGKPHRLVIAGSVDPANPKSLTAEEVSDVGDDWIDWLGHRSDVEELMREAHVVVLPSYREGLPLVLLEAGAVGRAILTTDTVGCREVCRDGINGVLVQPASAEELAAAMARFVDDPKLAERMGERNLEFVRDSFSEEVVFPKFLDLYRESLEQGR